MSSSDNASTHSTSCLPLSSRLSSPFEHASLSIIEPYAAPSNYEVKHSPSSSPSPPPPKYMCRSARHALRRKATTAFLERKLEDQQVAHRRVHLAGRDARRRRRNAEGKKTVKKPLLSSDAAFDTRCRCPHAPCDSHPGDGPQNAIHVDVEDPLPRATLAQRLRAPPNLLQPTINPFNGTVYTNLHSIDQILHWYRVLRVHALEQLQATPLDNLTEEQMNRPMDIDYPEVFPGEEY